MLYFLKMSQSNRNEKKISQVFVDLPLGLIVEISVSLPVLRLNVLVLVNAEFRLQVPGE